MPYDLVGKVVPYLSGYCNKLKEYFFTNLQLYSFDIKIEITNVCFIFSILDRLYWLI